MEIKYIYSEHPEHDIWENLLKFTYTENIKKFLKEREFEVKDELIETISGSVSQAHEYFIISKNASLQVSPLLLYYGTTNLLYGISCLLTGELLEINNHGMKLIISPSNKEIAETGIKFQDDKTGGVSVYLKSLSSTDKSLVNTGEWTVKEILGSIVETIDDFTNLYGVENVQVVPITKVHLENEEHFRINLDILSQEKISELLKNVPNFSKNYMEPQVNYKQQMILRKKVNGKYNNQLSYTGQKFLSAGYENHNNIVLPYYLYFFIILYAFGTLCRYHPELWNPFVQRDTTGEKNLVEKIIRISRRQIPNLILNLIFNKEHLYDVNMYKDIDAKTYISKEEIEELIKKELNQRR